MGTSDTLDAGATPAGAAAGARRVTVVVPTYNRAQWLGGAIASVLAQTHRDFELVVSDNCSTDETPTVVAGFDDPRLRYVRSERHVGLNEHYNLCVSEIETEYFLIVPDDDELLPDAIETLVPVLDAQPTAGIAHGQARLLQGETVIAAAHHMTGLPSDALEPGAAFVELAIAGSHRIHATTVLYRTEAVRHVPLDPRDFPATEFGMWLRLALDWDLAFRARPVAVYRMHEGSYTSANASVTGAGYIQTPETIANIRDVKLRFLAVHGGRVQHARRLRREAHRAYARQLVNWAGHATLPERDLGATAAVLARCLRSEPRVALEPGAWRLLAGGLLGPRLADEVNRRLRGRVGMREATR